MKNTPKILTILTLIFLITLASTAISQTDIELIKDVKLTRNNANIEFYSDNNPQIVDIEFTYTGTNPTIKVNVSDINNQYIYNQNTQHYDSIQIQTNNCETIEETQHKKCTIKNMILRTTKSNTNIEFEINEQKITKTITLKKSTGNPRVTKIEPEGQCHQGTCYVTTNNYNPIIIEILGSDVGVNRGQIAIQAGTQTRLVTGCENNKCTATLKPTCNEGNPVTLRLANYQGVPSRDDAGITIQPAQFTAICIQERPIIRETNIKSSSDLGIYTTKDSAIITIEASSKSSPTLNMVLIGNELGSQNVTTTCTKKYAEGTIFTCTATIKPTKTEPGTYEIPIIIRDIAGNQATTSQNFELVKTDTEETPRFWNVNNVVLSTTSMNKRNMAYERTLYAEINLKGNADLVKVTSNNLKCEPITEGLTGNKNDITSLTLMKTDKDQKKVYAKITLREAGLRNIQQPHRYSNYTNLEYRCEIQIQSKQGTTFYSKPQSLNFTFKINLYENNALDEYLKDEIEQAREDLEKHRKLIGTMTTAITTAGYMCTTLGAVDATSSTMSAAATVLTPIQPMVGAGVQFAADRTSDLSKSPPSEAMRKICSILTCGPEIKDKTIGQMDKLVQQDSSFQNALKLTGRDTLSSFWDPYKSWYVALATGCLPAMVHHMNLQNAIKCNYLNCLSNDVIAYGYSPSYCEAEKSYSHCVYNANNLLDFMPTAIFRDIGTRFSQIMSDPINIFGFATPWMCKGAEALGWIGTTATGPGATIAKASCNILVNTKTSINEFNKVSAVVSQIQSGTMFKDQSQTHCDEIVSRYENTKHMYIEPAGQTAPPPTYTYKETLSENPISELICDIKNCGIYSRNNQGQMVQTHQVDYDGKNAFLADSQTGKTITIKPDGTTNTGYDIKQYNLLQYDLNFYANAKEVYISGYAELQINIVNLENNIENINVNSLSAEQKLNYYEDVLLLKSLKEQLELEDVIFSSNLAILDNNIKDLNSEIKELEESGISKDSKSVNINKDLFDKMTDAEKAARQKMVDLGLGALYDANLEARNNYSNIVNLNQNKIELSNIVTSQVKYRDRNTPIGNLTGYEGDTLALMRQSCKDHSLTGNDCTRSNLNEARRNLEKQNREAKRDSDKLKRRSAVSEEFALNYPDWGTTAMHAWGLSEAYTGLKRSAEAFGFEINTEFPGHTKMAQWSQGLAESTLFGSGADMFCKSKISNENLNEGGSGLLMTKSGMGYTSGAYLLARKSALQQPIDENAYYDYWFEGKINPSQGELGFSIILIDNKDKEHDFTQKLALSKEPTVKAGKPFSFGGLGTSKTLRDENSYTRICVVFKTSNLKDYFDKVTINGNRFCQEIVSENIRTRG